MTSLMSRSWIAFAWFLFLYSSYFYKHHNQSPIYRRYLLILKTIGIYTTWNGCSLHDRVCSSNGCRGWMDGFMGVWKGNISTNVKCGITAYVTWHIVMLHRRCVWVRRVRRKQKERCEGSGRMWWNEANILSGTIYNIHVCIHVYRLYCHMNYICSWAHNGWSQYILYGWETAFSTRFQRYKSLHTAMHTSHAY